jgi:hypothetical protein
MRQRAGRCAALLLLLGASACGATDVEEVYGSFDGVDARLAGVRNGTKLTLVGERTGPVSEGSVAGKWVRFKVPDRNRARADAADQCLSIMQEGEPLPLGKSATAFRQDIWLRASALQQEEAELRRTAASLQAEIDGAQKNQSNAGLWLGRNSEVYANGRCVMPSDDNKPVEACAPGEETSFAQRRCKEAVVDCAVIAMTMGKAGADMFDSTFQGSQASQACGMQTMNVVGDDFGIAASLAAAMKRADVQAAAENLALDPKNPLILEQFAQSVLVQPDFADCQPKAERVCTSLFSTWKSEMAQRVRQCRASRQSAAASRSKIAQINQRREEIERQLVPIRQELSGLRNNGGVVLQPGCQNTSPVMTLRP